MKSLVAVPLAAIALAAATLPAAAWSLPGELNYHASPSAYAEPSIVTEDPLSAEYLPVPPLDCATTLGGRMCMGG